MSDSWSVPARHRLRDIAVRISEYCGVRELRFTRRDNAGRAHVRNKIIETGDPVTVERLYVVAHECGHIALEHGPRKLSGHRCEFEAEQFAILILRHFDVPVPYEMVEDGQNYVAWHIDRDINRYRRREIDCDAYKWASRYLPMAISQAVTDRRIPLVPFLDESQFKRLLEDFLIVFVDGRLGADGHVSYRLTKGAIHRGDLPVASPTWSTASQGGALAAGQAAADAIGGSGP